MRFCAFPSGRVLMGCLLACFISAAHGNETKPAAQAKARPELGTSAVFSPDGTLYAVAKQGEHILLHRSVDEGVSWAGPVMVNPVPEAISANGENRPRIVIGKDGALLVSWSHPLRKPHTAAVRLARSEDGQRFSAPITVHQDASEITHSFESIVVAGDGRIVLAWIDKRDLEAAKAIEAPYRGAAIYAATSKDGGKTFMPEQRVAEHACECCRTTGAIDQDGTPLFMWRHVFAPNERDHAIIRIKADGSPEALQRATFDRWKIDGCPHHGPSLAVDAAGVRHAVWFNQKDGEGRVFYGRLGTDAAGASVDGQRSVGGERAEHADLAVAGQRVALVWKEFDGEQAKLRAELSDDGGKTFRVLDLAASAGPSDQPRALSHGKKLYAFWRSEREGMRVFRLD